MLYRRMKILEDQLLEIEACESFFRVCIFGSARIQPETKLYNDVANMAEILASNGIDILTGGGPGLMEAANLGAKKPFDEPSENGKKKGKSFGISIELPFEPIPNKHLDIKRHHHKFSSRLDDFMRLSHAVICTPGGVGTLLEFFFCWQLIQVSHAASRPIILLDDTYWNELLEWLKDVPLKRGLISPDDFNEIKIVKTPEEAAEEVIKHAKTRVLPETCKI